LLHNTLGQVNTRRLHDIPILNSISNFVNDMVDKCRICLQIKVTKKYFSKIDISSTLLQLVHNDICDLHSNLTRRGK
jgi:hypothetical protein